MNPPTPPIREGDIVRNVDDGHLWRVTRTWTDTDVIAVASVDTHHEMAIKYAGVEFVERHPGGAR